MKKKILLSFMLICISVFAFGMLTVSAYTGTKYGDYLYYTESNGNVTITDCDESATKIEIPDKIDDKPVTTIGKEAFCNCNSLTSVTIPDSVTSIGDEAFYNCTGLTNVNITDIATWCNIDFSSVSANPLYYAKLYLNGKLVTDLVIPDGITEIKSYAFYCSELKSITIPDSVTSIGNSAFSGCYNLTNITIPNSINSISSSAFCGCSRLTSVTIPDSVTSIGNYAFFACYSLTSVTIPDSVTGIGDKAFYHCYYLENVYYHGTEEEWNNINIGDKNEYLNNAKRTYFAYVTFIDEDNTTIKKCALNSCVNFNKNGYTVHIYKNKELTDEFDISTPITEDTTLYLKYVVNQYTYKFLDEDNKTILKEASVDYGITITPPETPADKEPYTFDYWDGYTVGMILSDDVEFKAVYKYKDYKITAEGLENPTVVTYNSSFNIEPQKIDDYHYFIGYFTESDGKGRQITNEKGESLKAYDVVGDLTVYPHFYSGYMNKVALQGTTTEMPGDIIKEKAIFATDKEAMYFTATIKYPEHLNFKSISGGDFAEASKDSETLKDGFKYLSITCLYDYNGGNMPTNQNLIPFEITFEATTNAPIEETDISIENVTLVGDNEYSITDFTDNIIEIKPKLAESVSITGNNSIDKITKYTATVSPDYTTNKAVTWSVDNEEIATISADGTLTPIKNGTVKVTATANDGSGKYDTKTVNVTAYATIASLKYHTVPIDNTDNSNDVEYISIDIVPDVYEYTVYVKNDATKISLMPTYSGGTLKPNGSGIWISGKEKEFELTENETTITLNRNSVPGMTDNAYTITIVKFEGTKTTVSDNGTKFTVTPINIASGNTVILALYNGDTFVEMQSATYNGEDIPFTTIESYTKAKVFVWSNLTDIMPMCDVEIIE